MMVIEEFFCFFLVYIEELDCVMKIKGVVYYWVQFFDVEGEVMGLLCFYQCKFFVVEVVVVC